MNGFYLMLTTTEFVAGHVSDKFFSCSSVYNRFKRYLRDVAGLDDRDTPYSFRAGCSVTLELLGVPKSDVAKHLQSWDTQLGSHCSETVFISSNVVL